MRSSARSRGVFGSCSTKHSSSLQPEVWSIARARARVRSLALPLVQSHPPPRLNQRRLGRCVRGLQLVSEGDILWTGEPGASRSFGGLKIPPMPGVEVCCFVMASAVERRMSKSRWFSPSVMACERIRL